MELITDYAYLVCSSLWQINDQLCFRLDSSWTLFEQATLFGKNEVQKLYLLYVTVKDESAEMSLDAL